MSEPAEGEARVQAVLDVLMRLAAWDLDARVEIGEGNTPIELVGVAVNMLAEELSASVAAELELRRQVEQEAELRRRENEALVAAQAQLARQHEDIRALSTPVIEVARGVLILPLIGLVDAERAQQIMEQLLAAIVRHAASTVVLDLTGVPALDTAAAHHLLQVTAAAKLLGTRSVITGVSPDNAQTLVRLDVDFAAIATRSSLAVALREVLAQQ
jgi:rsbT co-antagonist protein RsbR